MPSATTSGTDHGRSTDNRAEPTVAATSRSRRRRRSTPHDGPTTTDPARYKTELCRSYEETGGSCRYGEKCQFAHGVSELRSVDRHPRYKTQLCRTFHTRGFCAYGPRCHFIHNVDELQRCATGINHNALDAGQLRRLVEAEKYILELSNCRICHHGSQHQSAPPPGIVYPSAYSASQSARRTSAPAVCVRAVDRGIPWTADSRMRSQSLSSAESSSSPAAGLASCRGLDQLAVRSEYVDPAFATIAETFLVQLPAFDDVIPLDVHQRINLLFRSHASLRSA